VAHVERQRGAHLAGQLQTVGVDVGDDHESGAGVADDGHRHNPDGTGPGDEHVLAEHVEGQGRVHRVAERVEDGGHVAVDGRVVVPDVGLRHRHVLREGAGTVDADALGAGAQVPAAGQTVSALAADDMPLAADHLAGEEVGDVGADRRHVDDELVADHHRHRDGLLGALVPVEDVQVSAADSGAIHFNKHVVDADLGDGHVVQPQARFRLTLDQRFHGFHDRLARRPFQACGRRGTMPNGVDYIKKHRGQGCCRGGEESN